MTSKKLLVVVVLLSAILGVDAISEKRTKKLYRKAGRWQQKLRGVWALLGVQPFLVQPGEEGDECVLKSKVEEDYVLKSTVEADYVSKVVVEGQYALKLCGLNPKGKVMKAGMEHYTVCGDPTGQTDCATKCFEDFPCQ